uniref:Migration and invasion enhancer 1 n=1 Tax=Chelydra serpentina TaxID=8475 RepID=A0A8C3SLF8_CHESE
MGVGSSQRGDCSHLQSFIPCVPFPTICFSSFLISEPCGFESTYLELASAVKEEYPDIEIESRLGGKGAFEIEINGQLIFSKLENGGFPYEKDLIEAIRRARNGEPLEKITNSRPPCVIL